MKNHIAYCGLDCENCGSCGEISGCEKQGMITGDNADALKNLKA